MSKRDQIQAVVTAGNGIASGRAEKYRKFNADGGLIRLQIAAMERRGFCLDDYFASGDYVRGTLNLSVAPRVFRVGKVKYCFENLRWTDKLDRPGQPPHVDTILLDEVEITFNGKTYKGMIHISVAPAQQRAALSSSFVDVIAEDIAGVTPGDVVTLHYDPAVLLLQPVGEGQA